MKNKVYSLLVFIFSANILFAQEQINHTSISFEGNKEFISSLTEILNQDFNSSDVKKALDPFNAKSVGFRAATKEELFENLPPMSPSSMKNPSSHTITAIYTFFIALGRGKRCYLLKSPEIKKAIFGLLCF